MLFIVFIFYSCATGVPSLAPNNPQSSKILSISLFFKNNINPVIQYDYDNQNYTYYFYACLFMRFDNGLISNNLDLIEHIFYFENGFKRINRVSPPSSNTGVQDEWSAIILDNNSQVLQNRELRFNIVLPDNIFGNKSFFNFIVLVFLRNYEYGAIADDFGSNPVNFFVDPSYSIKIDINLVQPNTLQSINNTYNDVVEPNLPPGFPDNLKESLKIEKIEYVYRVF
ncbi:MAG: hypothetical protein ACK4ZM_04835 [bacterium]